MPVRPAHWLSSSYRILSDRLSVGFSCGLCSGRSAVPSSVQPADLLRPDNAALPVLPDISGRHFFSTVPHDCFLCSEARHQPAVSAFPRTTVRRKSEAFPVAVSGSRPSPGVSVGSVCLTDYHSYGCSFCQW
ncbi:Uncharacterised protein [Shigella sonnei]|nr:Uncharacterised protein [Shigella sonnei]